MAGRGVDIHLGGNPEGLAIRELRGQGLEPGSDEWDAALATITARFDKACAVDAERVREAGGLYVLGSERHESRRIDNQLRGRSGRQGDPGESRFFLSLEDELMRLFATGAVSWVMDRTLPDDAPIEAKMVTKAIERAQNTVEGRNAEQRKDVLKYDEVMNEQRKVIYARRLQILNQEDLHENTLELIEEAARTLVEHACPSEYAEEWDLHRLVVEIAQYWPSTLSADELAASGSIDELIEAVRTDGVEFYERHCAELPGGEETARAIERDVMLTILDQRWRDHLSEMDYLREGIHLRGISGSDPLVAWQREGYTMFEKLLDSIDDDYLRYVTHMEAAPSEEAVAGGQDLSRATYEAQQDPQAVPAFQPLTDGEEEVELPQVNVPVVKSAQQKLGRNEPCWCGSGKKFKFCHGRA
jgi:preprotein translocase subunit SecA